MAFKTADQIRKGIAEQMAEAIKKGAIPWRQPWFASPNTGSPANFHTKRRYTGINTLILWYFGAIGGGFKSRFWGTSTSWTKETGAHVKKGQHATHVTLFKHIPKRGKDGVVEVDGKGKPKTIPIIREFPVFNVEQLQAPEPKVLLDGRGKFGLVKVLLGDFGKKERTQITTVAELREIATKYVTGKIPENATREELADFIHKGIDGTLSRYRVQSVIANMEPDFLPMEELYAKTKAVFKEADGEAAAYCGKITYVGGKEISDYITMLPKRSFVGMAEYYQTKSHELIHWVVNGRRIEYKNERKGKDSYAFIELVAEIGACFLNTEMNVPLADKMLEKSSGYVASWLKDMENDPKYIFEAASLASRACDYLLAFVGKANPVFKEDTDDEDEDLAKEAKYEAA